MTIFHKIRTKRMAYNEDPTDGVNMDIQDAFISRALAMDAGWELLRERRFKAAFRMFRLCRLYTKAINNGLRYLGYTQKIARYVPLVDEAAFDAVTKDMVDQISEELKKE